MGMSDTRLRIRLRAPTPGFLRVWTQIRALSVVWAEFIAVVVILSFFLGPIALLGTIAVLLTFALPILCLTLWGRSLDHELGWQDEENWR